MSPSLSNQLRSCLLFSLSSAPGCVFIGDRAWQWRTAAPASTDTGDPTSTDDTACSPGIWYADQDGDGYGDPDASETGCDQPAGTVDNEEDCDDTNAAVNPETLWIADGDGDGYGGTGSITGCEQPAGTALEGGDCDDADPAINPGAVEDCATLADDDCDGFYDAVDALGCTLWFADGDGDGFGVETDSLCACGPQPGYGATVVGDCRDDLASVNPDAVEICDDGIDQDCDDGAGACLPTGSWDPTTVDALFLGEATSDQAGLALVGGFDMNGDGLGDLAVGAPTGGRGGLKGGQVYLLTDGTAGGDLGGAAAIVTGASAGDRLGWALARGGDLNGDGVADLVATAPYDDAGGGQSGAAWLLLGPLAGEAGADEVGLRLEGPSPNLYAGWSVASGTDTDGDGSPDVLVGAYKDATYGNTAGAAYLARGPFTSDGALADSSTVFYGRQAGERAGYGLALGDLDGDGIGDAVVAGDRYDAGAVMDGGAVYLFLGPTSGNIGADAADAIRTGTDSYGYAGYALAMVGDTDGDGKDDLLVGAPGIKSAGDGAGAAYLLLGGFSGSSDLAGADAILDGVAGDAAGTTVGSAGDMDGDGLEDLFVGAPGTSGGGSTGSAYVRFGPVVGRSSVSASEIRFSGSVANGLTGTAVVAAGDLDGNGADDLAVGGPAEVGVASSAGAVMVLLGGGL